jgi:AcrR family transcriptional regulator
MTPSYSSPLREAQAAQTRARILTAAAEAFGESGYSGTSLARVAKAAGVSLETVKQHGPKSALLLSAFDQAFSGAAGDGTLSERRFGAEAAALPPEEVLPFMVAFVASANERVAHLWPRLLEAAAGDVDVAVRLEVLQGSRRTDMEAAVALFRSHGMCRGERPDAERAGILSFLVSPESYTQLVSEARWDRRAYEAWLIEAIEKLVLAG